MNEDVIFLIEESSLVIVDEIDKEFERVDKIDRILLDTILTVKDVVIIFIDVKNLLIGDDIIMDW